MLAEAIHYSELRSTLEWYFETKNLALKNALSFECPLSVEQQKELRLYYSEYFVAIVSAIDLLREQSDPLGKQFKERLVAALSFDTFPDGKNNYHYIRELRNSIVHRGLDICSAAHVYENRLIVVAPPVVFDQYRSKSHHAPGQYLIEIIAKCEEIIGPLIARHLEEFGLLKPLLTQDQARAEAQKYLAESPSVPDWVRQKGQEILSEVDFIQMQAAAIEKLVSLLNFNALLAE